MGWDSERKAIESRFKTNWTATPIKFEDAPFQETSAAYVALFIRNGDRSQVSLGNTPTIRSTSLILVQIFMPPERGTSVAKAYADSVAALFDRQQFFTTDGDLISCQTASAEYADQSSGFAQWNVSIPYTRDEQ